MIDLNQALIAFKKYLQNYDLEYGKIELKIKHTYGVVNASEYIAKELSLDDENIKLAKLIALLHDIGRAEDNFENIIDNSSKEILENDVISENIFNDYIENRLKK